MKTIEDIMKAKKEIEMDIYNLLHDFQIESGCSVESVRLYTSNEIGKKIPTITEVQLEVHLPRT